MFSFDVFFFSSQEAGWGCCYGDAALKECRGRRSGGQREEEDQCPKEGEERFAGKAHQTGCANRQSRCTNQSLICLCVYMWLNGVLINSTQVIYKLLINNM